MRILVTGITGFVGRHLVGQLLARGHEIVGVSRDAKSAQEFEWFEEIRYIQADLHKDAAPVIDCIKDLDAMIHLAWPGLPNYQGSFHVFENLIADLIFLKKAIHSGLTHLLVTGTCLEYGMQLGGLSEAAKTNPITAYGFAKDSLRKSLEFLMHEKNFTLQWMRLFYLYGAGQGSKSLLSQLDLAIDRKDKSFDMSIGTQLRDYMPIELAIKYLCSAVENPSINGVINCSSGIPLSVIDLVRRRCQERGSDIALNLGRFEIPKYEPHEFWGVTGKLRLLPIK